MKAITIKDVLYEFTFRWDRETTIHSIMFPDDNMASEKCAKVIEAYDTLYPIYGTDCEICADMVEKSTNEGLDEKDRIKIITELVELKGLNHNLKTIIA